jgi:5-formyltetrahydrofolate cyclo-ligase
MAVPPPLTGHSAKSDFRQMLREQRDARVSAMTTAARDAAASLCWTFAESACRDARVVAAYLPIGTEMGTAPIIAALHQLSAKIALPRVTSRSSPLQFFAWHPGEPLATGPFGLQQPANNAAEIDPDVILTPLLGFDRVGNRIGYGAGHYDRAFAAHPHARRVGIAWSFQHVPQIPVDPWDVPLHAIATEREWIPL